jgi:DNA-binding MarR family transcriptional regulator
MFKHINKDKYMRLEDEIKQSKFNTPYHKLMLNILYTGNWLREQTSVALEPFNLTPQQFNILRILRGQSPGAASIGLLQERMLDKRSDTSRLVERLRQKGLLERNISMSDRRACEVCITDQGLDLLRKIDEIMSAWEGKLVSLTIADVEQMNQLLDKMRDIREI